MIAVETRRLNKTLSPFWLLFILTGLNLFNYVDRFILSAVLTPLQLELHINDGSTGRIVTAFMIGYFVTSPFFGYLGDRFPRKWLIALGIFIWSLGTVLTGMAATFSTLLFYRILVGVGEASYATISPGLISDVYPASRRNNALTIFYAAIPVGAAIGFSLGGVIAAHFGWRPAFIWAGVPGLFLALILLPFKEPTRGGADDGARPKEKPTVHGILSLFKIGKFNLLVLGYTAYTFALGAFGVWGSTFLHRVHHVANERAAYFFAIVLAAAGLVGTLLGGFVASLWQKRNPAGYAWLLALSVLAAVPIGFIAFLSNNTIVAMTALAVAMLLLFLSTGPTNTLILETVPVHLRSSAMALSIFMIHMFGDMWSPEIVGRLSDCWGDLRKAVLILPGALLVSGLFWLALALKTRVQKPLGTAGPAKA